jgi:hypothetical protein
MNKIKLMKKKMTEYEMEKKIKTFLRVYQGHYKFNPIISVTFSSLQPS